MDETTADVNSFNVNPSNSSKPASKDEVDRGLPQSKSKVPFDRESMFYNTSGNKYLLIFSHDTYQRTQYFMNKRPSPRKGARRDVIRLQCVFVKLGFKVEVFNNLDRADIITKVTKFSNQDHSDTSCVSVAIMTHGKTRGELYAADRPYLLSEVISLIQGGDSGLVGKPKLFFVQACRGGFVDEGRYIQMDGGEDDVHIPTHADTLVLCSSVEGYLSWKDDNGSWLIQTLCDVIAEYHDVLDILQMITLVKKQVAFDRATNTPKNKGTDNTKQMPETRFTLTRFFMFKNQ